MKKIISLLSFILGVICTVYSQVTNYGTGSGTLGTNNSFFGTNAGNASTAGGYDNSFFGSNSGKSNNAGFFNVAVGARALFSITNGSRNIAIGNEALYSVTYGMANVAVGNQALRSDITGGANVAIGDFSLNMNTGDYNIAIGWEALRLNTTGEENTTIGSYSLSHNTVGDYNTASGQYSMYSNITGYQNTAVGLRSLYSNTSGYRNTAIGSHSLYYNLLGDYNTATGFYAMYNNNMGIHNTGTGFRVLYNNTTGNYNTAHGAYALEASFGGNYNTATGYKAGPSVDLLNNTTAIGYLAVPTASNQVRIGNTSVNSIGGEVGWTAFSDGRFKKDIKEDVSGLDFIKELRPVSYTVDKVSLNKFLNVSDSSSNLSEAKSVPVRQTGFIAQEVEAIVKKTGYVFSGVDAPENENDPYGIRYAEFVVPLVKGMQELTARLEEQEQKIVEQEQKIDSLLNQLGAKSEIEKNIGISDRAVLFQNNPNPFNAETKIKMTIPENVGFATVMIYNLEGKQMKNIQVRDRGEVSVKLSGSELSAGMYLYALIADGKVVDTKRMILTQ